MASTVFVSGDLDPVGALQAWRRRALQVTIVAALVLGLAPLGRVTRDATRMPARWPALCFFGIIYVALLSLLLVRRLDHWQRVWGVLLTGYAMAGWCFAHGGLAGSGRLYLLAIPPTAIALAGLRAGTAATCFSALVYGGFAYAAGRGWLRNWLVHPEGAMSLSVWLDEGATFGVLLIVVSVLVGLLVEEQTRLLTVARDTEAGLTVARRRLRMARDEERRALAYELHDGPIQDLIGLSYELFWCRDEVRPHDPALAERVEAVRGGVLDVIRFTRETCNGMLLQLPDVVLLRSQMVRYARAVSQESGLTVHLSVPWQKTKIPSALGIALLRVYQEAVTNAVKHAGVDEVWAAFEMADGRYVLQVRDEGRGFVVPDQLAHLGAQGHIGLMAMEERIQAVGGHFEVRSTPGEGTTVRVWGGGEDDE